MTMIRRSLNSFAVGGLMQQPQVVRRQAPPMSRFPGTWGSKNLQPSARRSGDVAPVQATQQPVALTIEGNLPPEIDGILTFNGPGTRQVHGTPLGHLLDGDAKPMQVCLNAPDGQATYRSAFVDTPERRAEQSAKKLLYPGLGTLPPRGLWDMLQKTPPRNPPNISMVYLDDQFYASGDGSWCYALDAELNTLCKTDLGLEIKPRDGLTAHPEVHRTTGSVWYFSLSMGHEMKISFLEKLSKQNQSHATPAAYRDIPLGSTALVHALALSLTRAIVVVGPYGLKPLPLQYLLGQAPILAALQWQATAPTRLLAVNLADGTAQWSTYAEALFPVHTVAAKDAADGGYRVDVCAHKNADFLTVIGSGQAKHDVGPPNQLTSRLMSLQVSPQGNTVQADCLCDMPIELPRRLRRAGTEFYETVFGITDHPGRPGGTTLIRIDATHGKHSIATLDLDENAGEPIPVAKAGKANSDAAAWLLCLVSNKAKTHTSLCVFDGEDLPAGIICRMALPEAYGDAVHGIFVPRALLNTGVPVVG